MAGAGVAKQIEPPSEGTEETERQRFIAAVEEGLADANAGRVCSHAEVEARMRSRFGGPTG